MMNVFQTHAQIVNDYASYIQSFLNIADPAIRKVVEAELNQGKRELPEYYLCRVRGDRYAHAGDGTGSQHSFRYDVRGHFRRLPDRRLTWVRSHQRGLEHELYKPKTYEVR